MATELIQVEGLLTVHCARNVEAALRRLLGVHHADANYLNHTATVHFDEQQVALDKIREVVRDCGYVCHEEEAYREHAHHGQHSPVASPVAEQAAPHEHHMHAAAPAAPHGAVHNTSARRP